jgi:hypothetical protein
LQHVFILFLYCIRVVPASKRSRRHCSASATTPAAGTTAATLPPRLLLLLPYKCQTHAFFQFGF